MGSSPCLTRCNRCSVPCEGVFTMSVDESLSSSASELFDLLQLKRRRPVSIPCQRCSTVLASTLSCFGISPSDHLFSSSVLCTAGHFCGFDSPKVRLMVPLYHGSEFTTGRGKQRFDPLSGRPNWLSRRWRTVADYDSYPVTSGPQCRPPNVILSPSAVATTPPANPPLAWRFAVLF